MKKVNWFKFNFGKEVLVVLLMWCLVVCTLYTAFQVFTTGRVAANFLTFGFGTIFLSGIALPLVYTKIIKGISLELIGITKKNLIMSIFLGIGLTLAQYSQTLINVRFPVFKSLIPLLTMVLAVGLFENIFFRGWMQYWLEETLGVVPSILTSSVLYSLYHIGYGMTWAEMNLLLFVGLFYAVVYRLIKNIFILFPFLTPSGALFTNLKEGLHLPFEATYGFLIIIALSSLIVCFFYKYNNYSWNMRGVDNV